MNKKQILQDERALLSPPGDTIIETLGINKMSQVELADRMGKTSSKINDIISGKEPITTNTAFQLEKVLNISAQFWLNREIFYREKLARIQQEETLLEYLDWVKLHPIKELKNYGYLKSEKVNSGMANELLQFFGVASPIQWEKMYVREFAQTDFRKSKVHQSASASIAAWLRMGEIEFKNFDLPRYDKTAFKKTLHSIKKLVYEYPEDYAIQLKDLCSKAGVAIVYTGNLPKAPISGATRWVGGNPLIQLTDRYKSNDRFWFTFFHEAAHVLLHGKKNIFIENDPENSNNAQNEKEANAFAEKWLLPSGFLRDLPKKITELDVKNIAREYNTHPAIVVSRLQKLGLVPRYFGANLKAKLSLDNVIKTTIHKHNHL